MTKIGVNKELILFGFNFTRFAEAVHAWKVKLILTPCVTSHINIWRYQNDVIFFLEQKYSFQLRFKRKNYPGLFIVDMYRYLQPVCLHLFWSFWPFLFSKMVKIVTLSNTQFHFNTFKIVNSATVNCHSVTVKSHFKIFLSHKILF